MVTTDTGRLHKQEVRTFHIVSACLTMESTKDILRASVSPPGFIGVAQPHGSICRGAGERECAWSSHPYTQAVLNTLLASPCSTSCSTCILC